LRERIEKWKQAFSFHELTGVQKTVGADSGPGERDV
jgi:hypothetical protein